MDDININNQEDSGLEVSGVPPEEIKEEIPVFKEEVVEKVEAPKESVDYVTPTHNYTLTGEYRAPDVDESLATYTMPTGFVEEVQAKSSRIPNVNLGEDPATLKWRNAIVDSFNYLYTGDSFNSTLSKTNSHWNNVIEFNGVKLAGGIPKISNKGGTSKNSGERAVLTSMNFLGLGSIFSTPLWDSGFWVTFKPVTDSTMVEFHRLITADKIRFGREVKGWVFSNMSSFTMDRIFDLAIGHIYSTTLRPEVTNKYSFKELVSSLDIPSFIWGFVCTMYPRGFNYERGCINDPEKCRHVVEERLNLSKLQWTDTSALSDKQKLHMSDRKEYSMSWESIEAYRSELVTRAKRRNVYFEGTPREFYITLRVPTVAEYIDSGHRWIDTIADAVTKALGTDGTGAERNAMFEAKCNSTIMSQYIHWIDSIEIGTVVADDRASIEDHVNMSLSTDEVIYTKFIEDVLKYIDDSTITVVGIPGYDCPKCNTPQEDQTVMSNHKYIIPLDMVQLFFDHVNQRIVRLKQR